MKTKYPSSTIRHDVPYISQFTDIKDNVYFALTACGLVSVFMVLLFKRKLEVATESSLRDLGQTLVQARENPNAYCEAGWRHDYFVQLSKDRDFPNSFRKEKMTENDLEEIISFLYQGKPVIVSVKRRCLSLTVFHMVVLTGFRTDENGDLVELFYNDPASLYKDQGKDRSVSLTEFLQFWRGMAIFID